MSTKRLENQYREWRALTGNLTRRAFLESVGAVGAFALAGPALATGSHGTTDRFRGKNLTIFHAGSLSPPFKKVQPAFEKRYGVNVLRQPKGSVASTKKITELGRTAGVLAVSDYRLLRDRLLPDFGDWYAIFATNAMSIQYRPDSPGAGEITTDNWWEILSRDGVRIGHSDPAIDPGGYRAVMAMQLGKIPFHGKRLYDESTYKRLMANSVVTTNTEISLEGQLKAGKLDYVFYYQSISASADAPWVNLQPSVDLSRATPEYARHYAKAVVKTDSGMYTGAPIAYGITVPSVAANPDLGAQWVQTMITGPGITALNDTGFVPVQPAVVPAADKGAVPANVMAHATARSSLGPLAL